MKIETFDDLVCPFNYNAELKKAREALKQKIVMYVLANREKNIRELAAEFKISSGAMLKITKEYCHRRKLGRPSGRKVTFDVWHLKDGEEQKRQITVKTTGKRIPIERMRSRVVSYFNATRASVAKYVKTEGCAEWNYNELEKSAMSPTYKGTDETEMDIRTLLSCIEGGSTSESGEIAYRYVIRWLKDHRQSKHGTYDRAHRMAVQYAALRGR